MSGFCCYSYSPVGMVPVLPGGQDPGPHVPRLVEQVRNKLYPGPHVPRL